ncbi:hypothetical protein DFJ74DRAFT_640210 [Hyaloraphidium curvatum]|nr:hypothetical protein DFJ74DRAFT_640210 [Hyaloraphidium curvatum]
MELRDAWRKAKDALVRELGGGEVPGEPAEPPAKRRRAEAVPDRGPASNTAYYASWQLDLWRRTLAALSADPPDAEAARSGAAALLEAEWLELHSRYYKDVSAATRRAYADAALCGALCASLPLVGETPEGEEGVVRAKEAIGMLDDALVMVGRPRGDRLVDDLVEALEGLLEREQPPVRTPASSFSIGDPPPMDLTRPVRRLDKPMSLSAFAAHVAGPCTPFVVSGLLDHWPALSDRPWSDLGYFEKLVGRHRRVPVELGGRYTDDDWAQKIIPFGEFLDDYVVGGGRSSPGPDRDGIELRQGYLAQHDLMGQIPRLRADVAVPDYAFAIGASDASDRPPPDPIVNLWFGPAGTVSPAHTDPHHNLYAQVAGHKYARLFAPSQAERLYPAGGIISNTSRVDVEDPDLAEHPLFAGAEYEEAVLAPGDLLFIPKGWWHYLRSLTVSCSVSFWLPDAVGEGG